MRQIISWNVNGVRAVAKKGFGDFLISHSPDVLCLQETKAHPEQLPDELRQPEGYHAYWASAEKKGYSGVAVLAKEEPVSVSTMGVPDFDREGRVLVAEFANYTVISAYFPNSQDAGRRLGYKLEFCAAMLELCNRITSDGRRLLLCGDYNIAHRPIDLARPKENEGSAGYLPEERAWMDTFIGSGYVDTFRRLHSDGGHYTWWSYITRGRERNVGWRIDYHCVNPALEPQVSASEILPEVYGSDHAPILVSLTEGET
jgi:exodeoxyribonuclease III